MRRPTTKTLARMILNVHGTMDLFTIMKLTLGGWPWLLCCFRAQDWTPTWQAIVSSGLAPLVITIEGTLSANDNIPTPVKFYRPTNCLFS